MRLLCGDTAGPCPRLGGAAPADLLRVSARAGGVRSARAVHRLRAGGFGSTAMTVAGNDALPVISSSPLRDTSL